jgi:bifunctional non-homologous end joining protein LigD
MATAKGTSTTVQVGDRELTLSNLDKALYPAAGFTKAEVISYYARIAPVMLPHVAGRAMTFRRFPNGVDAQSFFEKNCPGHRPPWVDVADGPGGVRSCLLDEPAALVWAANMAALELHAPMALADDLDTPRAMVFDLDPGAPAAMRECCEVALLVQQVLEAVGLQCMAKTSGSKGLQVYAPLNSPTSHDATSSFALALGQLLEQRRPDLVLTTMTKALRNGKIFVDWSQNNRAKTTIAAYSLRARERPTVSTPVTWDEVSSCAAGGPDLRFEAAEVLRRVEEHGDLFAPVLGLRQVLPSFGR